MPGPRPQQSKKSLVRVALEDQLTPSHWGMKITKSSGKNVQLSVMSSADAIVGKYTLFVETKTKTKDKKLNFRMEHSDPIYILFNAWCKGILIHIFMKSSGKIYMRQRTVFIRFVLLCGRASIFLAMMMMMMMKNGSIKGQNKYIGLPKTKHNWLS